MHILAAKPHIHPKLLRLPKRRSPMTFIVGMKCSNGIVLCADSLEDDGVTKKLVDKIMLVGSTRWGVAVAGAGPGSTIDKFCGELQSILTDSLYKNQKFDFKKTEKIIEGLLSKYQSKYVKTYNDQFKLVIAMYDDSFDRRLYVGQGLVLSPVGKECHAGCGNEIWRLVSDMLYQRNNCVADNIRLAVFATRLAIKFASGVDEPVHAISYTFGDGLWKIYSRDEISEIEKELPISGFKEHLQNYWRLNNPPTLGDQLSKYRGVRTPGDELTFLRGVKVEEVSNAAGRRKASRIFASNTDKLHKRALLEMERKKGK